MGPSDFSIVIGVGIYSIPEASRLTGVSPNRIRRWVEGYAYQYRGETRQSPPVWQRTLPDVSGEVALSFLDLIEIRFIDGFLQTGVGWKAIRAVAKKAYELHGMTHPFSTREFKSYGRTLFTEVAGNNGTIVDFARSQLAWKGILAPYLVGLEFSSEGLAERWWPREKSGGVVLDPARSFGAPIVAREGVPTATLASAFRVEASARDVATIYEVSRRSVEQAVEFEDSLKRKAA
jgi:uncharacterized protein (DUF433 family)